MKKSVIEYFKNYFGDELNESTSHEMLIEAALDLVELRNAVLEANVGRAAAAHGAREAISSAIADKAIKADIMNTRKGRRLIKRHTTPIKKSEEPKIPWYSLNLFPRRPSLTNPQSGTFTRSQRTKQLASKAIEAGPQTDKKTGNKPSEEQHSAMAQTGFNKGKSDMESRLEKLAKQGQARKETKLDIDIHDSYDPAEKHKKYKKIKKRIDDAHSTTVVPGVSDAVDDNNRMNRDAEKIASVNRMSANPEIDIADLKHPEEILGRPKIQQIRKDRAEKGELRKRGKWGRDRREARGQGTLFK
jgi:hypothetical protein